jgi:hypothetical protein
MNTFFLSHRRTDEELYFALFETDDWTVNGRGGQVLCVAPSLRLAIDMAKDYALSGATVVALVDRPMTTLLFLPSSSQDCES